MATTMDKKNQLVESVLSVFSVKGLRDITLADVADECGSSALALRLKYGSIDKVLDLVAHDCYKSVFSPLEASVRAGKSTEECWVAFRDQVVESYVKVLFYEAYREHFGRGFEDLSECQECAMRLFPAAKDLHFLWSHFIFDAKRSASKVLRQMKVAGVSRKEAEATVTVPDLCSTTMRAHIINFEQLCEAM